MSFIKINQFNLPEQKNQPSHMEKGKFYDLKPPCNINGKIFHRVQCDYQVPRSSNEYVVKGIPEGSDEAEDFILRFTDQGVTAYLSESQEFE